jgi:glycosyltransferase involved in cell wall biosynthesis
MNKLVVLDSGSCGGIEISDYSPTAERLAAAATLRESLKIPADAPVVGFIGRLTKDKGIIELLQAFSLIRERLPETYLLLIGSLEEGDPIPEDAWERISTDSHIRQIPWIDDPRPYLHLMDIFALPTYREGLPGVLLEAAAAEKPIVAARATGVVDVVVDEVTGLLCPIGDAHSLARNALRLLLNAPFARSISRNALLKVKAEFSRERVLQNIESFYLELLGKGRHKAAASAA